MVGQSNYNNLPPVMKATDYNFRLHPNENVDLALIKLRQPLTFSRRVAPIRLPESYNQQPHAGEYATVVGWGVKWQDKDTIEKYGVPQSSQQLQVKFLLDNSLKYFRN